MTVTIPTTKSHGILVGINRLLADVEICVHISDSWKNNADELGGQFWNCKFFSRILDLKMICEYLQIKAKEL